MTKYIRVDWPEYQIFEEHDRINECYKCTEYETDYVYSLMVPEDLYKEVINPIKHYKKIPQEFAIEGNTVVIKAVSNQDYILDTIAYKTITNITTTSGRKFYLSLDQLFTDKKDAVMYNYYIESFLEEV